jgi:hypothetical protein
MQSQLNFVFPAFEAKDMECKEIRATNADLTKKKKFLEEQAKAAASGGQGFVQVHCSLVSYCFWIHNLNPYFNKVEGNSRGPRLVADQEKVQTESICLKCLELLGTRKNLAADNKNAYCWDCWICLFVQLQW